MLLPIVPQLWTPKSPALFCPDDICISLCWQCPSAPSCPSTSLSFQTPFARHAWNTHPQDSCWQKPHGALNRVGVGGPPTAAKLHKMPVILLAPPSATNVLQKKASKAVGPLSVQVLVLKAHLQRIFVSDKEVQAFSLNKNSQRIRFPHPWVFILLPLLTYSNLALFEHILFVLHLLFPSVIPHVCPNPPHVFCNCSKCFPLIQGEFKLPVPGKHSSCPL